ncbi:cytochrome b5-like [Oryza brachyantha]|uniref:Cytochrome b5 heme-binding domain-containing protein n=1 Tax=Oryza brachyantha TaxID=4533 RepID=J3LFB5_ORYBR|nr:cytochrome b5-like [Oryza brachyantha]
MAAGGKAVYSFQEVSKHNDRKDCWLIIGGKVYDVSPFMEEHPGGDEVLLACTGKDATADFNDIGHTATAKELMAQYVIGEVDASTRPPKPAYRVLSEDARTKPDAASGGAWLTMLQLAVPVALLGLAFAAQNFAKTSTE